MQQYESVYTGEEIDESVEKSNNAITNNRIKQTTGSSATDVISQVAITQLLNTKISIEDLISAIAIHNSSSTSHEDIRQMIEDLLIPIVNNNYSTSQLDTYSCKYSNDNFASKSFISKLFANIVPNSNRALLKNTQPSLSSTNILTLNNSTNYDYNWNTPDFVFDRVLENSITIDSSNGFTIYLPFKITNASCGLSWGANIQISQDNGSTWTSISNNQSFSETTIQQGTGVTSVLNVYSNTLLGSVTYPVGTILRINLYQKHATQTQPTSINLELYCGVNVDGAGVFSYAQFNFLNANMNTTQIEDNSITWQKLDTSTQNIINNKLDKNTSGTTSKVYSHLGSTQTQTDILNQIVKDSTDLVTSGAIYNAIQLLQTKLNNGTATQILNNAINVLFDTNTLEVDSLNKLKVKDNIYKTTYETYTISTWQDLLTKEPFRHQAVVTATHTISTDTLVELINDNAVLFANCGFAIGYVTNQEIGIYCINEPTENVNIKIGFRG